MTHQEIKAWLKASGHNRAWLAQQLGVAVQTVNGWLSVGRTMTPHIQAHITLLMQQCPASMPASAPAPAPAPELPENVLVLTASPSEFAAWNTAALASGQLVTEWAASVLNDVAASIQP